MQHIDEHTLELYVLESETVSDRLEEIAAHLKDCHGCRTLVGQIQTFYDDAAKLNAEAKPIPDLKPSTAITRSRADLAPFADDALGYPAPQYRPRTALQRLSFFFRTHPYVTMTGGGMTFAAIILGIFFAFQRSEVKDKNPVYYKYDTDGGFFQIFNSHDEKLWELSSSKLRYLVEEHERWVQTKSTIIADLDNDGKNEVVTTVTFDRDDVSKGNYLRVYNFDKTLRFEKVFEEPIKYMQRQYSPYFGVGSILVDDFDGDGRKEIIVHLANVGRSPAIIKRLDESGHTFGEYWHFGYIDFLFSSDVDEDGKLEVVCAGINDSADSTGGEFPAIVVLDPRKLVGIGKASASPGFGLPESNAEVFYLSLPTTDIGQAIHVKEFVTDVHREDKNVFAFHVRGAIKPQPFAGFQYEFSNKMEFLRVRTSDQTNQFFAKLVGDGKLSGKLNQTYLGNLQNRIRYWDGKEWQKEACRVRSASGLP